mmetsp:Transcript_7920/g.22653  ORF Transcript_7920/g.22653 Transcript_7920/m.22653 type:complete len:248 (-) Transcript_7920:81-824(-)
MRPDRQGRALKPPFEPWRNFRPYCTLQFKVECSQFRRQQLMQHGAGHQLATNSPNWARPRRASGLNEFAGASGRWAWNYEFGVRRASPALISFVRACVLACRLPAPADVAGHPTPHRLAGRSPATSGTRETRSRGRLRCHPAHRRFGGCKRSPTQLPSDAVLLQQRLVVRLQGGDVRHRVALRVQIELVKLLHPPLHLRILGSLELRVRALVMPRVEGVEADHVQALLGDSAPVLLEDTIHVLVVPP